jgi:hypothetical protein
MSSSCGSLGDLAEPIWEHGHLCERAPVLARAVMVRLGRWQSGQVRYLAVSLLQLGRLYAADLAAKPEEDPVVLIERRRHLVSGRVAIADRHFASVPRTMPRVSPHVRAQSSY